MHQEKFLSPSQAKGSRLESLARYLGEIRLNLHVPDRDIGQYPRRETVGIDHRRTVPENGDPGEDEHCLSVFQR